MAPDSRMVGEGERTDNFNKQSFLQILSKNGIPQTEVDDLIARIPPLHGDHFASSVFSVTAILRSGERVELFVKKLVDNPKYNAEIQEMRLFEREAAVFNDIAPFIQNFAQRRLAGTGKKYNLDMIPKCYFANNEMIVMENLGHQNFSIRDKFQRQDMRFASVALKALAKYHAPSYILLKEEITPAQLEKIFPALEDAWAAPGGDKMIAPMFNRMRTNIQHLLKMNLVQDSAYGIQVLAEMGDCVLKYVNNNNRLNRNPKFFCINHGDLWNNNMLFRETCPDEPPEIRFVDYQIPRIISINLDLGNYIYASIKPEIRQREIKNILRIYYDSFVENVTFLGSKVQFTFEEFVEDFKKNLSHGFVIGLLMITLTADFEAKKDLDKSDGGLSENIGGNLVEWLEKNPKRAVTMAQNLVQLFQERRELLQGA